jgi:uncharacterized DUF497 family protein
MALNFEWDAAKAAANLRKHGVGFDEACSAFADPLSSTIRDPMHSMGERRFVLLGRSSAGRLLVVSHTDRGATIRFISARPATRPERKSYEEND